LKCLLSAGRYEVFGCDISRYAFGHYIQGFARTFLVDRKNYTESVIEVCREVKANCIIPGGEEPLVLLAKSSAQLSREAIHLAANSPPIIATFTDKKAAFETLRSLGFTIPLTLTVQKPPDLDKMVFPCIVKPSTGSGGSSFVLAAEDKDEAWLHVSYLIKNGKQALVQEYLRPDEGEFTVGVLSLPNGHLVGSIALRRMLDAKLSVLSRGEAGVISSGYSQGLIDDFPQVREVAEKIAVAIGSTGPLNVQGRVKDGVLIPFEINPRFSASTYLRAMAGFNEVDLYLQFITEGVAPPASPIRPGYYLRGLSEVYVGRDQVIQ
jgi:carbamoyl-phosphate synthase large subunit